MKRFSKLSFFYTAAMFFYKFFWRRSIKLVLYVIFFKLHIQKVLRGKKSVLLVLKKKRKSYVMFSYFNSKLILSTSLGTALRHLKLMRKNLKRQRKGFQAFISTFKRVYLKFKPAYDKSVFIDFFNFYLVFFWKRLSALFESRRAKLLFNLNTHNDLLRIKRPKGVKKRIIKKAFKTFLAN